MNIPESSPMIGHSIQNLEIRTRTGASVVAVLSDGELSPNPSPDHVFRAKDMVAILGNHDEREKFALTMGCEVTQLAADISGVPKHRPGHHHPDEN